NLVPIIARAADSLGCVCVVAKDSPVPGHGAFSSEWVFLARKREAHPLLALVHDRQNFGRFPQEGEGAVWNLAQPSRNPPWTDEYTNLVESFREGWSRIFAFLLWIMIIVAGLVFLGDLILGAVLWVLPPATPEIPSAEVLDEDEPWQRPPPSSRRS